MHEFCPPVNNVEPEKPDEEKTEIKTEFKEFSFDDFVEIEPEMIEIQPPPRFLAGRKRSIDEGNGEIKPKRGRRGRPSKKREAFPEMEEGILDVKDEIDEEKEAEISEENRNVLGTDDEDTEDLNQRRSVRIWSNKIRKELVEEQLPDEIDGWKIPTDEEELEDGDDVHDSSFECGETSFNDSIVEKRVKVRSKRATKFREPPASANPPGRPGRGRPRASKTNPKKNAENSVGRPRRRRRIIESDSDEEEDREEEMEKLVEQRLSPMVDDFEGHSPEDGRPNNVELLSIEDVKASLKSDDEQPTSDEHEMENEPEAPIKLAEENSTEKPLESPESRIEPDDETTLAEDSATPEGRIEHFKDLEESDEMKTENSVAENSVPEDSFGKALTVVLRKISASEAQEEIENGDLEAENLENEVNLPGDLDCGKDEPEEIPAIDAKSPLKGEMEVEKAESEGKGNAGDSLGDTAESSDEVSDAISISSCDLEAQKLKLLSRGSPVLRLERICFTNLSDILDAEEAANATPAANETKVAEDECVGEIENETSDALPDAVQMQPDDDAHATQDENGANAPPEDDDAHAPLEDDHAHAPLEDDHAQENEADDFDEEIVEKELADIHESDGVGGRLSRSPTSPRKSPRLSKPSETLAFIRRSGRERKTYPCAVKGCDAVEKDMDRVLRHVKVNHPSHYASLITIKHSKVFKICEQCQFIFMCRDTFDSHRELSLCNGNKRFWQTYLKDDKFDELDMKILTENYEWKYSQCDLRRSKSKRRSHTPSRSPGKVSPSRAPSRPTTPSKPAVATRKPSQRSKEKAKLVTRSGRKVKVPQHDGIGSEIDSHSDEGETIPISIPIPQLDGNDVPGGEQQFAPGGGGGGQGVQMAFAVNQGNSGVIPILMPPGTFGTKHSFSFTKHSVNIMSQLAGSS